MARKMVVKRKAKKKSQAKAEAEPITIRSSGTSGIMVELSEYRGSPGVSIARCGLNQDGTIAEYPDGKPKFYKRMFFSLAQNLEKENNELPTSVAEELAIAFIGFVSFHLNGGS